MSLGYIPPVERLKVPTRRGNSLGPLASGFISRKGVIERIGHESRRRGIILDLDDTLYPRERFVGSLHDDVSDVLHALRTAGWRVAVLTNGVPSVQFRKIAVLGLASLVDDIVYAEEHVAGGKPAAAAFTAALRALELDAEHCISVGDDLLRDVRGARALGIRTIRIARPGVIHPNAAVALPGATPPSREEADMVIDSLRQLPEAAGLMFDTVTAHVA
jgi:HAD superfamily hydrolase (TIGR01509 family)